MGSEKAQAPSVAAEIALPEVETSLRELLRAYKGALKFAADMPTVGRSTVSGGTFPWRWGSRLYTRVYVETHVRKRLEAIRRCLRLELLGTTAGEDRKRIEELDAQLAQAVEPLLGWRRLAGLLTRLPPVAAALPVVSAAAAVPLGGDVGGRDAVLALAVLGATALGLWILVVWPSVRLGFRVKRAIFCGGRDFARPVLNDPGHVRWEGFASGKAYEDPDKLWLDLFRELAGRNRKTPRTPFPHVNVYEAEDRVFAALGRRKPAEVPVDMLLGFTVYVWFGFSALVVIALVQIAVAWRDVPRDVWPFVPVALLLPFLPFQIVLQAVRNYRQRPH